MKEVEVRRRGTHKKIVLGVFEHHVDGLFFKEDLFESDNVLVVDFAIQLDGTVSQSWRGYLKARDILRFLVWRSG